MPKTEIDDKPFSESTLTKLELFERYAREWLPVFLSGERIAYPELNICDFFSSSGSDSNGVFGSALRLLKVICEYREHITGKPIKVRVFLSDVAAPKIARLKERIEAQKFDRLPIELNVEAHPFGTRFRQLQSLLASPRSANLLIVDQYGVKHLDDTFDAIVQCSTTDFLAFVSSSWFQRFHSLPEVAKYLVNHRPEAYHLAHRVALEAYRKRLPKERRYYLGEFSLKSGSNIYGVIFGSAHPLGMAKFLKSAWELDGTNGSANFDVEREGLFDNPGQQFLFGGTPKKLEIFDEELEQAIRNKTCVDEMGVLDICLQHGVTPQHASTTIKRLKKEGVHQAFWWVPDPKNHREPRPLLIS